MISRLPQASRTRVPPRSRSNPDWQRVVERALKAHGFDVLSSSSGRVVGQDRLGAREGYHSQSGYDHTPATLVQRRTAAVIAALGSRGFSATARGGEKGWVEVEVKRAERALVAVGTLRPTDRVALKDWSQTGTVIGARAGRKGPQYRVALDDGGTAWWEAADTMSAAVRFNPGKKPRSRVPVHTRVIAVLQKSPHPIWATGLLEAANVTQRDVDRLVRDGMIMRSFAPPLSHEAHGHTTYRLPARRNPSDVRAKAPKNAHPAYLEAVKRHRGHIDYDYWLERLAPYEAKLEIAAKTGADKFRARPLTTEDRRMMATERAEEARYGRRMRAGMRRENPVIRVLRATLEERIALAKRAILADVAAGNVPRTIRSFAKLHDYVDANEYGGWGQVDPKWEYRSGADAPMANAVQVAIDAWIKAGGLRGKA